jgi:hypothetical protein
MPTLRTAITQARPAACLVRDVVLPVRLSGRPPAARPGAGGVPDLGQVPELDPGVIAPGLEPVIAVLRGDGIEFDDQVRAGPRGAQPPAAVSAGRPVPAGRGEPEPGPARRRPWSGAFPVALGFGPGAAVPDGVALLVGHRDAPGGLRVGRGGGGQVAGQPRVDGADAGDLPGPVGQVKQGDYGDGEVSPPSEPSGYRSGRMPCGGVRLAWPAARTA